MTCQGCKADKEPFYVGDNPRLRGVRSGYLPSVCDGCFYKDAQVEKPIIKQEYKQTPIKQTIIKQTETNYF